MIWLKPAKKLACVASGWLVVGLLFAGCAADHSTPVEVKHSPNSVATGVDTQDLMMAAEAAVASLLESGVLDHAPRHPAVLSIGLFANNTSQNFDTRLLTHRILTHLVNSGKVVTAEKEADAVDSQSRPDTLARIDFVLSGRIIQTILNTRSVHQSTYTFQFSLADRDGLIVWKEEKQVTKLTKRFNAGF